MKIVHFLSKRAMQRRSFLKGAGALLALPFLEAMRPACAAEGAPPRRFVAMHYGLGFHTPYLFPKTTGANYELTPYLEIIKEHRKDFTVFSGISHPDQRGANGHTSEMTWLTGAKHPGLPGFRNSISIDQLIAEQKGHQTRFPYLALSVNGSDSASWTANGVNLPGESSPARLFRQLFVNGTQAEIESQMHDLKRGRSILDTVNGEARKLRGELGRRDQDKLDQYLTAVRDAESRIQQSEGWVTRPKPVVTAKQPIDVTDKTDIIQRTRLMHDLIVLALQTDSTRVITYRAGGMNAVPKIEGVSNDWHQLSHHGLDPQKIDELQVIEKAEFQEMNRFFSMVKSIQEGPGSLFDSTAVLLGSNLGNASSHETNNMPVILAGGGFRHGQHLAFDRQNNTPLCNLFVSVLQRVGVESDRFGSSTGTLTGLSLA